ncbi:LysR family transcriptional regulator [Bacillus dakarensis]|nr:LysR family transcriptional regulator [Bacillus dakarensis]
MDIRQLHYFKEIVKQGSISKALFIAFGRPNISL